MNTGSFNNISPTVAIAQPQVITNPSQPNSVDIQNASKIFSSIPRERKGSLDFSKITTSSPSSSTPTGVTNPTSNAHKRLFSWLGANKATPNQNEQPPK